MNRRVSGGGHGVDLERNWGIDGLSWGFGKKGKDGRKDKEGFQGLTGFSEPETKALRDYIRHYATGPGRVALLHVRCCVGSLTPPQPYERPAPADGTPATDKPRKRPNAEQAIRHIAEEVRKAESSEYAIIQREEKFNGRNTGNLIDWAYGEMDVDHAYVFELRARLSFFFGVWICFHAGLAKRGLHTHTHTHIQRTATSPRKWTSTQLLRRGSSPPPWSSRLLWSSWQSCC